MTTIATTPLPVPLLAVRLSRLVGKAPWGVADQMLISGSNLVVIMLLVWALTQDDMGAYVLVAQFLFLFNSIHDGLITQPHNVIGSQLQGQHYRDYSRSTLVAHLALLAAFVSLTMTAWAVAASLSWWPAPLLLALAPATLAWQTQELVRRIFYTEGKADAAFLNDLVGYGGQAALVSGLWWYDALTGPRALYAMTLASGVAAILGLWRLRQTLQGRLSLRHARRNWRMGKWLAGGELAGVWLGDAALYSVAAAFLGKESAAIIRAIHTLFGPSRVVAMALNTMLPIHLARRFNGGASTPLAPQMRTTMFIVLPAFGAFCLVMAIFAYPILLFAFGADYAESAAVMRLYALAMLMMYAGMVLSAAMKAKHATRPLFGNRLAGSLVTLGCGIAMLFPLGLWGVPLGMAMGHLSLSLLNAWWLGRHGEANVAGAALDSKVQETACGQEAVT